MPSPNDRSPDDEQLVRYLVGLSADEETERLDERSIADDQFASRLREVESDLVDAYARNELAGEVLSAFEATYSASPDGREKVRFAETLFAYLARDAAPAPEVRGRHRFSEPRRVPAWASAAAAVALLSTIGYLLLDNRRVRHEVGDAGTARAALEARAQALQQQLNDQRTTNADTAKELARVRESLAQVEARTAAGQPLRHSFVAAFVFPAPRRGANDVATIAVPRGAGAVALQLEIESDNFPAYRVAVKAVTSNQTVWRGTNLHTESRAGIMFVSITVPADLLTLQTYTVELAGVPKGGPAEPIADYPFRVELR